MSGPGKFEIRWVSRGRRPRQPPNPAYPQGCHIDLTVDAQKLDKVKLTAEPSSESAEPSCVAQLPYPTGHVNIGTWMIKCLICRQRVAVTAASRPDDPKSVRLPCKIVGAQQ